MPISRYLDSIRVRRMLDTDVPQRAQLLRDPAVMRNIIDVAAVRPVEALEAGNNKRLTEGWADHLDYVFESRRGEVIGFGWLAAVDWVARRCEFSIAVLPRYRSGLGHLCYVAMMRFVFERLNLDAIYCQVYETNKMMMDGAALRSRGTVKSEYDVFVAGEWRTCYSWMDFRADFQREMDSL